MLTVKVSSNFETKFANVSFCILSFSTNLSKTTITTFAFLRALITSGKEKGIAEIYGKLTPN